MFSFQAGLNITHICLPPESGEDEVIPAASLNPRVAFLFRPHMPVSVSQLWLGQLEPFLVAELSEGRVYFPLQHKRSLIYVSVLHVSIEDVD